MANELKSACMSKQSDQSSSDNQWLTVNPRLFQVDSKEFDRTLQMCRLISLCLTGTFSQVMAYYKITFFIYAPICA